MSTKTNSNTVKNSLFDWCQQNNRIDLLHEYNIEKNEKNPRLISYGSTKMVFWKCSLGHEWESTPNNRTSQKCNCPICGNKKVLTGFNDVATTHPKLIAEWHSTKNHGKQPTQFVAKSNEPIWWVCEFGHEFSAQIVTRTTQKTGCPFCSNKKLLVGFNDLSTTHPAVAIEWNYEKNNELLPNQVIAGTHKKVWWKCKLGHEWQATISSRSYGGNNCPYCANQKVWTGFNDLETVYPALSKEWDVNSNKTTTPSNVIANSNKSYFWICSRGHSYKAPISQRIRGRGCPYCAGRKILIGYNDLSTTEPQISKEWHPYRNLPMLPTDVSRGSDKIVWWQCSKGHEWEATISSRSRGNGCPTCAKGTQISLPEKAVAFYMQAVFPDTQCNVSFEWSGKMEVDIFIPSISVAIEYDGWKWHQNVKRDIKKDKLLDENGIRIIRIREEGCPNYSPNKAMHISSKPIHGNVSLLDGVIRSVFDILQVEADNIPSIDVARDYTAILKSLMTHNAKEPFLNVASHLANEWNFERNGQISPDVFSFGSQKKVWWKCGLGHEWQAVIASRVKGTGCPICYKTKKAKDVLKFSQDAR